MVYSTSTSEVIQDAEGVGKVGAWRAAASITRNVIFCFYDIREIIIYCTTDTIAAEMAVQSAQLAELHRADGSATYTSGDYTVIAAVNGPIEVQRRDELAEEAAIEVNIRPASGVGSKTHCAIFGESWL